MYLLDKKQYYKANQIRLSKTAKADSDKTEYDKFIRTHAECPECNSPLKRQNQGHDTERYIVYKCSNPICPAKSIRKKIVYEYINEIINRLVENIELADIETKQQITVPKKMKF